MRKVIVVNKTTSERTTYTPANLIAWLKVSHYVNHMFFLLEPTNQKCMFYTEDFDSLSDMEAFLNSDTPYPLQDKFST